jgi:hypothetical protein
MPLIQGFPTVPKAQQEEPLFGSSQHDNQTDKRKQGVCQSHCRLAIYIKKYLKAKEEVSKLMLSPTSINEKITYVYILKVKKQHTQPDKPSTPPSQAHCQSFNGGSFTCTPLGLNT